MTVSYFDPDLTILVNQDKYVHCAILIFDNLKIAVKASVNQKR